MKRRYEINHLVWLLFLFTWMFELFLNDFYRHHFSVTGTRYNVIENQESRFMRDFFLASINTTNKKGTSSCPFLQKPITFFSSSNVQP